LQVEGGGGGTRVVPDLLMLWTNNSSPGTMKVHLLRLTAFM